jgi:YD repeat-containing protein
VAHLSSSRIGVRSPPFHRAPDGLLNLKTLLDRNGARTTIEQHTLSSLSGGVYQNGNRASDTFQLKGPDGSAPCHSQTCTASWLDDARERLVREADGAAKTTLFTLDTQGNVTRKTGGGVSIARTSSGQGGVPETL